MLRLSLRTLFSLTPSRSLPPYSILIARCSTSSPPHLTYPHSHRHPDPSNVRVSVWWDLDKCNVPSGLKVCRGVQAITAAIESTGIKGAVEITAFGDMARLAKTNQEIQEALSSTTAIEFRHVPPGEGDRAGSSLFLDLMRWVSKNPPPVHLFLVTVDGGSSACLHQLRMENYNILLAATKESAPAVVCSSATILWDWHALVRGENLTGRHFNQPPGFWYGRYEGPLENPFTKIERPASASDDQTSESDDETSESSESDDETSESSESDD